MLAECHAHAALDGVDWRSAIARHKPFPDEGIIRKMLSAYRDAGVGYVRDGGDACGAAELSAKLAPEYGIEYRMPVFPIHKKGNYGSFIGRAYETISDYRALVAEAKARGADFIKIMISGILDFGVPGVISGFELPFKEVCELVEIAHDDGFRVMAHVNGASAVLNAAMAGIDSIEHGYYTDREARQAMADNGCIWVPTLAPFANQLGSGRFPDESLRTILSGQYEALRDGAALGIPIACGSDAGAFSVMHAEAVSDERRYLAEALGESADDIVSAADFAVMNMFRPC